MDNQAEAIDLICVMIDFGMGSKIIKSAKHHGIMGATVTLGLGTVNNRIWDFIGLSEVKKEIIFMIARRKTAYIALEEMNKEFKFCKPNHGIAFTTCVGEVIGAKYIMDEMTEKERVEEQVMYQSITVIVDKGKGEEVIDAATKAGSKGGTIMNARGSGIHETSKLFAIEIEPEKEIVIILSEIEMTDAIVDSIREHLKIDEPGNGIIYIQKVNKTYGVYK
ncbi:nitrogen regulatory protein P-II family [Lachnotalea glycerini]|uniref:Nitrogen regulatory protein P-II family n=1 Tax=Lachnotalea glycerini TaxID=1763509 RepID=A0A318EIJ0_9FIRM|nr:P-II family nitrogen regulator [Lachnotalea glycerini]PXV86840.1 nitrogen regulatory protein P-II family [Lachnotalea glycerini]